jgi:hypothetical protein
MNPAFSQSHVASMKCMEIRGGSRAVEEAFDTPGLDAWLYSRPFEGAERGGDLHYVSVCGGGVITRVVVADVSGHGARVAEFSDSASTPTPSPERLTPRAACLELNVTHIARTHP